MADYPSVPQAVGSAKDSSSGTVVDRAVSGKPRFRSYYSQIWDTFRIVHDCSDTEYDSIITHYNAHQFATFNFLFSGDGATYSVRYGEKPQAQPTEGDFRWQVRTVLILV